MLWLAMAAADTSSCPACGAAAAEDTLICASCGQAFNQSGRLRPGYSVADRYEIRRFLGEGGMGTVYEAFDHKLEERIALKILKLDFANSPEMERRFRHEIKLARRLRHSNVCAIHEYGEAGPLRYIAMELIEGTDLRRRLRQHGAMSAAEGFKVTLQIAQGLDSIHKTGVVHRDLKTSNVMLDKRGDVRLMDFGIAKQLGVDATLGTTAVGSIVGTPEYMSPEQGQGHPIDFRSDIYSLGIVVYEIFTGDVPFRGDTPIATLFRTIQEPIDLEGPTARGIPDALKPVLLKALAKTAPERFASVEEMLAVLVAARDATLGPGAISSFPPTLSEPAPTMIGMAKTLGTPRTPHTPEPAATLLTPATMAATAQPRHGTREAHSAVDAPPPRRGWSGALTLLGIAAVVGGIGLGLRLWIFKPANDQRMAESAVPEQPESSASPLITSETPSAAPFAPRGLGPTPERTPITTVTPRPLPTQTALPNLTATPSSIRAETARGTSQTPKPSTPPPTAVAAEPGQLQLYVKPWAQVTVDGQDMGTTPFRPLTLPVGTHRVQLKHPAYAPLLREVAIASGITSRLEVNLPTEAERIPPR